jgi:hypothetical protein
MVGSLKVLMRLLNPNTLKNKCAGVVEIGYKRVRPICGEGKCI